MWYYYLSRNELFFYFMITNFVNEKPQTKNYVYTPVKEKYILLFRFGKILLLIFTLLGTYVGFSQVISNKGRFSVEYSKGCVPLTINITELDGLERTTKQYFYEDGEITNNKTHTYLDAGIYEIVQVVGVDSEDSKFDTLRVEAIASVKPQLSVTKCGSASLWIRSIDRYYDFVEIRSQNSLDTLKLLPQETDIIQFLSSDISTINIQGIFKNSEANCNIYIDEITPLPALIIPDIIENKVKEICKDQYNLSVVINNFDSLVDYKLLFIQNAINTTTPLLDGKVTSSQLLFEDIIFDPNHNYCLQILSTDSCSGRIFMSDTSCKKVSSLSLSPFELLYSGYTTQGLYINLEELTTKGFIVHRALENNEFVVIDTVSGSFIDKIESNERQYRYKIDYVSPCNQLLYSANTHPPLIHTESISTNTYRVTYIPPNNSLTNFLNHQYTVGITDKNSTEEILENVFTLHLRFEDGSSKQILQAKTTYEEGIILFSNQRPLKYDPVIYVPSAFTPNDDGLNDTLELFGATDGFVSINIYSKWGDIIYATTDLAQEWDGTINGNKTNEGIYLYEIIFYTVNGEKMRQRGTFVLIRN